MPGDGTPYENPHEQDIEAYCNCDDPDENCKHIVALLITLDELDYEDETLAHHDGEGEIHPSAWRSDLPLDRDEFWTGGTLPAPRDGSPPAADAAIIHRLGNLNAWVGPPYFENLMTRIYRDATRHAATMLGYAEPEKRPRPTPAHSAGTLPRRPKIQDRRNCGCPTCAGTRRMDGEPGAEPRDDTVLPGLYDEYLMAMGYRWTPCGRRLQPPR